MKIIDRTRLIEEKMAYLFSVKKPFSEHLMKWEDAAFPDKYDHNAFEYSGQPTSEEFEKAMEYQKSIGAAFIKLEGNEPLEEDFGLEGGVTFTMALKPDTGAADGWKNNEELSFRKPASSELEEIEVKHFGASYGEDFSKRNVRRLYEKLDYLGAYLEDKLIGACYSFSADGITCIDGLIVDEGYRNQYVATSILGHIKEKNPEDILILHADSEDTPKDMYLKMGFETVDSIYEYFKQLV